MLRFGLLSRGANLPSAHRLAYYRANSITDADGNYDITAISHPSDTVLTAGHTYSLHVGLREALGSVDGVDHWAFSGAGVPKTVSYETIQQNSNQPWGYIFWSVKRGLCVFDPSTPIATMRKVWKYMLGYSGLWYTGLNIYGVTQTWPVEMADYFVDAVRGSDSNDGLSPFTPFATIAALDGLVVAGVKIGLAAGGHWREEVNLSAYSDVKVAGYGQGKRPLIDASDIVANDAFAKTDGYVNIYEILFNADTESTLDVVYEAIFEDGVALKYVTTLSLCDSQAGSFYVNSTEAFPKKIYVHASDSSDVTINGKLYESSSRDRAISAGHNAIIKHVHCRRNIHADGSLAVRENGYLYNCLAADGNKHNVYFNTGTVEEVVAWKARTDGRSAGVLFVHSMGDATGKAVNYKKVVGIGTSTALSITDILDGAYGHDAVVGRGYDLATYEGCSFSKIRTAMSGGKSLTFDGCLVQDCCSAGGGATTLHNVKDTKIIIDPASPDRGITLDGGLLKINNSVIIEKQAGIFIFGRGTVEITSSVLHREGTDVWANYTSNFNGNFSLSINKTILSSPWSKTNLTASIADLITQSDNNVFQLPNMTIRTGGFAYTTVAAYRAANPTLDVNSVIGNPLFVNPTGGDFSLQAGSPAIAIGAGLERPNIQYLEILSDEILAQW